MPWCSLTTTRPNAIWSADCCHRSRFPNCPKTRRCTPRTLAAAGYFEALGFSDEDRQRADFYRDNARRVTLQAQAGDVDAYLASLEMVITFRPFDATGRARIGQLINKSNQFNLTTRRYTEAGLEERNTTRTASPYRSASSIRLATTA